MPGAEYVGTKVGSGLDKMKPVHVGVLGAALVGVVILGMMAARNSLGGVKTPGMATEDVAPWVPPLDQPVVGPQQLPAGLGGFVFLPHRYPARVGGEVTLLIKHGTGSLRLPHDKDTNWIVCPPGEVSL